MWLIKIKKENILTYRSAYRACWERKIHSNPKGGNISYNAKILSFDYFLPYGIKFKYQSNFWKDKVEQDHFKVIYFICG